GKGGNTLYVPGLRASTNPIKGLNVQGEIAWQLGQNVVSGYTEHRDAMAIQALASYSLPVLPKYKPTVNASYTYFSGDKMSATNGITGNKDARRYSAWDVFMGDYGAGTIYSSIYPLTNMNIISAGASVNPLEDFTAAFTWSNLWAADSYSSNNPLQIYQPTEGTELNTVNTRKDARGLGNEYDVNLSYNYTEDVTFGVSLGWYVPGSALSNTNRDTASQAIASLGVKF
ncbi:MAG: alginate export family protein, partial [Candidatus Omnitrophica bacterium]|nr:alginate export family protein [Candidatus Omnitrophota bacterium]